MSLVTGYPLKLTDGDPVAALPDRPRAELGFAPAAQAGVLLLGGAHGSLAVARSLGRQGVPVWFLSHDHPIAAYSRYTRRHLTWAGPSDAQALDYLRNLALHDGLKGWVLFPSGDAEVRFIAENRAELARFFRLFSMPWPAMERLNDKASLYALAASLEVPFPRTYPKASLRQPELGDVRLPAIVKPAVFRQPNALTRAKAWRVDTERELEERCRQALALMGEGGFVVQELIAGDGAHQFSYAGLWNHGKEVASLTARRTRQFPIDFGLTSTFVETIERPEITVSARRLLQAVGYHGLVEMEFKKDERDGTYKVLDANTRAWAWIGISASSGIDFPFLAFLLDTGQSLPRVGKARAARWVHPSRNTLSLVQQVRRGGLHLSDVATLLKPATWATYAWDDPIPGVVDFPIALARVSGRRGR